MAAASCTDGSSGIDKPPSRSSHGCRVTAADGDENGMLSRTALLGSRVAGGRRNAVVEMF